MTEEYWLELATTVLADTALTTRFSRGHSACATLPEVRRATGFAAWKHTGQFRKGEGKTPYFDVAFSTPVDWPPERQLAYFDWASQVVAGLRGCNAVLEALFDEQVARSRESVLRLTLLYSRRDRDLPIC